MSLVEPRAASSVALSRSKTPPLAVPAVAVMCVSADASLLKSVYLLRSQGSGGRGARTGLSLVVSSLTLVALSIHIFAKPMFPPKQ